MLRDYIISLSLANLCFSRSWMWLLYISGNNKFNVRSVPTVNSYLSIMINVILLSFIFFVSMRIIRKINNDWLIKIAKLIFILLVLNIVNVLRSIMQLGGPLTVFLISLGKLGFILFLLVVISIFSITFFKFRKFIIPAFVSLIMILFPYCFFTFGQSIYAIIKNWGVKSLYQIEENRMIPQNDSKRVLLLIFDELDQNLCFSERPSNINLPNLDRLRREGFFAQNAYAPGPSTMLSIPAYITGRFVINSEVISQNEFLITYKEKTEPVLFNDEINLFNKIQDLKMNVAALGFGIPYCRVFHDCLNFGAARGYNEIAFDNYDDTLIDNIRHQIYNLFPSATLIFRYQHIRNYNSINENTIKLTVNPDYNFIFVHYPIPHSPYIYNLKKGETSLFADSDFNGYFANLELVDKTIGEIRKSMEEHSTWDNTTIIITADHPLKENVRFKGRKFDKRIPFITKFVGQNQGVIYKKKMNTVLLHDLILKILEGKILTPEELSNWINKKNSKTDRHSLHMELSSIN